MVGAPAYLLKHRIWSALTNYTGFSTSLAEASNCMPVAIDVDSPRGNAAAAPLGSSRIRVSGARSFARSFVRSAASSLALYLLFGLFSPALPRVRGHFARPSRTCLLRRIADVTDHVIIPDYYLPRVFIHVSCAIRSVFFSQPIRGLFLSPLFFLDGQIRR